MCDCYDALLDEDLITPVHRHDNREELWVHLPDTGPRMMPLAQANQVVKALRPKVELTDVEHIEGGPRGIRRRHILRGVGAGLGALIAPSLGARYSFAADVPGRTAREGEADLLVVVFLRGGMDALSLLPPDDAAYRAARPVLAVPDAHVVALGSSGQRLNTNASALLPLWNAGQLALVLGCGIGPGTRSHFDEMARMERAAAVGVRTGWIGRHLASSSAAEGTFRAITWGGSAAVSLATSFPTLAMSSIDTFNVTATAPAVREDVMRMVGEMYQDAGGVAAGTAGSVFEAIDGLADLRGDTYIPANGAVYPNSPFGLNLRNTAELAKSGKGLEVACVDIGDWDMHQNVGLAANPGDWYSSQIRNLAEGLEAFRTDLGELWQRTTVVTMTEFGRRVKENGSRGLDHGRGMTMFVAGGAVVGGLYGSQPADLAPENLTDGDLPITTDYRDVLAEIVRARLANGANLETVFPGFTPTPVGVFG